MKIVHVSSFGQKCGVGTYANYLLAAYKNVFYDSENIAISLNSDEAKIIPSFSHRLKHYQNIKLMQCDVLHAQHEFGIWGKNALESIINFYLFIRRAKKTSKSVIVTVHTIPRSSKSRFLFVNWFKNITTSHFFILFFRAVCNGDNIKIHVMSKYAMRYFKFSCKIDAEKLLFYIHPFPKFNTNIVKSKQEHHNDKDFIIGIFGFVSKYKGYSVLLSAMKYLPESYKILLLGGSHPESKGNSTLSEIALSKVNQYPDRITTTFIPDDAEIHQYMEKCDVIVAPYLPVNLSSSGAITHAISSGIPVIASNINAFIELYKEAECFYPIDYNSPEQLAAALIDLPKNVHLRNKLISASRSITEKHSWENMVKSLHDEL